MTLAIFSIIAGMITSICWLPIACWATQRDADAEESERIVSERYWRISWQLNEEHSFWLRQFVTDSVNADVAAYCAWKARREVTP